MKDEKKEFKAKFENEELNFIINYSDFGDTYTFYDENNQLQDHQSNISQISNKFFKKFNDIIDLSTWLYDLKNDESVTLNGITFS